MRYFQRSLGVGIIIVLAYLSIVVVTTPNLAPVDAVRITVSLNWWVIAGISVGAGIQTYLVTSAKSRGCSIDHGVIAAGTSGFSSGVSSFLSFLSLIPLGCCGSWLYVFSFLPGLVGTGISGFLIAYRFQFQIGGLLAMVGSISYTYFSTRKVQPSKGQSLGDLRKSADAVP